MIIARKLREWKLRRDARRIARLLRRMSIAMLRAGWPRWRRKQFWNDLIKYDSIRAEVFGAVERQLK